MAAHITTSIRGGSATRGPLSWPTARRAAPCRGISTHPLPRRHVRWVQPHRSQRGHRRAGHRHLFGDRPRTHRQGARPHLRRASPALPPLRRLCPANRRRANDPGARAPAFLARCPWSAPALAAEPLTRLDRRLARAAPDDRNTTTGRAPSISVAAPPPGPFGWQAFFSGGWLVGWWGVLRSP
jgi:hypothetical protein